MPYFPGPKIGRLFFWVVIFPLLLAGIYFSFLAVDRYVSSAQITVREPGSDSNRGVPGLALLLGGITSTSREETLYLREYISSQDMLDILEKQLNWHEHYIHQKRDPIYWLAADVRREDMLRFYQRVVTAYFDEETGLLTVNVEALDPEFSRRTLEVILAESERFINEMSHKMAREQMRFSEEELARARKNYEEKRQELMSFQEQSKMLDAQMAAQTRATAIATLEAELIREKANLKGLLSTLDANTPQVRQQKVRIQALEQQLQIENDRLVSSPTGDHLNVTAALFRNLSIDVGIAEEAYKLSVSAVENARIEASKKIRAVAEVVSPNMPDLAIYPRRIYNMITILIGLLLLYGIVCFILATIEDHRD